MLQLALQHVCLPVHVIFPHVIPLPPLLDVPPASAAGGSTSPDDDEEEDDVELPLDEPPLDDELPLDEDVDGSG